MRLLIIGLAVVLGVWLIIVAGLVLAGRRSAAREISGNFSLSDGPVAVT